MRCIKKLHPDCATRSRRDYPGLIEMQFFYAAGARRSILYLSSASAIISMKNLEYGVFGTRNTPRLIPDTPLEATSTLSLVLCCCGINALVQSNR